MDIILGHNPRMEVLFMKYRIIVKKYHEAGYPVVYADTAGFKGSNLIGHEIVVEAIIEQFVGDYEGEKKKGLINLWLETPFFNTNWRGDYLEIVRILKNVGFEVNVLFGPQSGGAKEWKEIPKAQFNLVISPWVGVNIAKHLEKKYNQPYLHIPVIPIGEEATTAFIRQLVEYAGINAEKSEAFIAEEAELYYYFLDSFSHFFCRVLVWLAFSICCCRRQCLYTCLYKVSIRSGGTYTCKANHYG